MKPNRLGSMRILRRVRGSGEGVTVASRNGSHNGSGPCRVAMYSPGMVGFGHIRRNASIAQALRSSALRPAVVMIAEAWQAGTLPMPAGVDCVTLPSMRKEDEGRYAPRFMDISDHDLVAMRSSVIRGAMEQFDPDVLIADHLPLGAARELAATFVQAGQPDDMFGLVVTGPYMAEESRARLNRAMRGRPRLWLVEFLPDPIGLVERADRMISMGGYNTVCEVLSFDKRALIV